MMTHQIYCWDCGTTSGFYTTEEYDHEMETFCKDCLDKKEGKK